jgi:hypothetical protein
LHAEWQGSYPYNNHVAEQKMPASLFKSFFETGFVVAPGVVPAHLTYMAKKVSINHAGVGPAPGKHLPKDKVCKRGRFLS